jgi:hypothetical protein
MKLIVNTTFVKCLIVLFVSVCFPVKLFCQQVEFLDYALFRPLTNHVNNSTKKVKSMEVVCHDGTIQFNPHLSKYLQFDTSKRKQVKRQERIEKTIHHYNSNGRLIQRLTSYSSDTITQIENFYYDSINRNQKWETIDIVKKDTTIVEGYLIIKEGRVLEMSIINKWYSTTEKFYYNNIGNRISAFKVDKHWYVDSNDTSITYQNKYYEYDSSFGYLNKICSVTIEERDKQLDSTRLDETIFSYNGKKQLLHRKRVLTRLDEQRVNFRNPNTSDEYFTYDKKGNAITVYKIRSNEKGYFEKMYLRYNKNGLVKYRYTDYISSVFDSIIYETYRYTYW